MSCCVAHWAMVTDPNLVDRPCVLCRAVEALEEIQRPPGSDFGDHRQRLAFVVAVARLALVTLKGEDSGKGEHRPTEDDPS